MTHSLAFSDILPFAVLLAGLLFGLSACSTRAPSPSPSSLEETPRLAGDRPTGAPFATRSPVYAQNGMAATSQPLATQVAIDILKDGGNALDAAIAANAALGVMEPTGNGIGGDLFALVWDPETEQLYGLNGSGRSPRGLTFEQMREQLGERSQIPKYGPLPVSVPGTVDGWFTLHERFGSTSMQEILRPAVEYAREGFPITPVIADYWQNNANVRFVENEDLIPELENFRETFLVDGRPPEAGDVFRNPDLANTLELIAAQGRDAFYEGPIAETIDTYMRRIGGYLRKEDLAAHSSTWVDPISTTYRGYRVYELPPNTQGTAALQMLNVLESYDLASMDHNSAEYLHLQIEAKKLAFADRARYYSDPAFAEIPLDRLISKEYAEERRELIDRNRARQEVPHGDASLEEGDTIYLTVADESGMMVSLIQSNYWGLGSGLVPDGLGFMLQDRGALFSMDEGHPNAYEPGKRPFHTIIPALVTLEGEPFLSFGVMGGAMQPQGHVQILCNIIDFGMNVQEAGDVARYRHTGSSQPTGETMDDGGIVQVETGISPRVVEALIERGHNVTRGEGSYGGYQGIMWDRENEVYIGGSEMRKDGHAAGF